MKVVHGDLIELALEGEFDVIVHGCNCFCEMGAGIAKTIKKVFPEAYAADLETAAGDRSKLGDLSVAPVVRDGRSIIVVNAYTQFRWGGRGVRVDYDAIGSAMRAVKARFSGLRIGYPQIGAGLARGDWNRISGIIDFELAGEDHTLVVFDR